MKSTFTDVTIRSLPPGVHFDPKTPGFGIRVGKQRKTWLVVRGRERLQTVIGHYPALSLQAARIEAKRLMLDTPGKRIVSLTFAEVRRLYLTEHTGRPRTKKELERLLTKRFAKLDTRHITTITDQDIADLITDVAPSEGLHAFRAIRALLRWATRPPRRYLTHNPLEGYDAPKEGPSRERVLTPAELKAVWHACPDNAFGRTVKVLMLTGCRKSEPQHLTLEGDLAHLAAEHSKNHRAHLFPVLQEAQKLLTQPLKWGGWGKSHAQLKNASKVANWTLHDLRRTYATTLASLQVPPFVIEALLSHKSGQVSGVAAIYNRYTYLEEMREAVGKFENWFETVIKADLPG